mgnify:CR=1 FL=1
MGKKILYAAYGSNINLEQMAYRCPNSTVAGAAMLKGYELQFRYHATIEPNADVGSSNFALEIRGTG